MGFGGIFKGVRNILTLVLSSQGLLNALSLKIPLNYLGSFDIIVSSDTFNGLLNILMVFYWDLRGTFKGFLRDLDFRKFLKRAV